MRKKKSHSCFLKTEQNQDEKQQKDERGGRASDAAPTGRRTDLYNVNDGARALRLCPPSWPCSVAV